MSCCIESQDRCSVNMRDSLGLTVSGRAAPGSVFQREDELFCSTFRPDLVGLGLDGFKHLHVLVRIEP